MSSIRLGVLGCGFIGHQHLRAAQRLSNVQVVAVVDADCLRAKATAEEFNVCASGSQASVILDNADIDAVVLAIPTAGRTELALAAFRAGKHVLLEKPAAMNASEVRSMLAAKGNLTCACGSSRYRFTNAARRATRFLVDGALGDLRMLRCRAVQAVGAPPASSPPPWRVNRQINGGGILVNWGSYDLDFLLGITGWSFKPAEVLAQTWRIARDLSAHVAPGSDAESHVSALIRCHQDRCIALERGEFLAAPSEHTWEIIGSQGSLRINMCRIAGPYSLTHYRADPQRGVVSEVLWTASAAESTQDDQILADGPLQDFVAAIGNQRPPQTGLEQALTIVQITDAIYASALSGRALTIAA